MPDFTNSGPVCLTQARSFINGKDGVTVAASNICTSDLFSTAGSNGISLPGGNDDAPHGLTEFYGMNYTDNAYTLITASFNPDTPNTGTRGNADTRGYVYVYYWNGSSWTQKGQEIYFSDEYYKNRTQYVDISNDGNKIIVSSDRGQDQYNYYNGRARVYTWNSSTSQWVQKGGDLTRPSGSSVSRTFFGRHAQISNDGNIIAIGSAERDDSSSTEDVGRVEVYEWNSGTSSWDHRQGLVPSTTTLIANMEFGQAMAMSSDGTIIAAFGNKRLTDQDGIEFVEVFVWNSSTSQYDTRDWFYTTDDGTLDIEYSAGDNPWVVNRFTLGDFGLGMSDDGAYIIVGDRGGPRENYSPPTASGDYKCYIGVYAWDGSNYNLRGSIIELDEDKESVNIEFVKISNDGTFIAIGLPEAEKVKSWDWNSSSSSWVARPDLTEPAGLDGQEFGIGIDIFDNNTIAVGGGNDLSSDTNDKGFVVVFEYNGSSWSQKGSAMLGPNVTGAEFGTSVSVTR